MIQVFPEPGSFLVSKHHWAKEGLCLLCPDIKHLVEFSIFQFRLDQSRAKVIKSCVYCKVSWLNAECTHSHYTQKPDLRGLKWDFWPVEKGKTKCQIIWPKTTSHPTVQIVITTITFTAMWNMNHIDYNTCAHAYVWSRLCCAHVVCCTSVWQLSVFG